MQAISTHDHIVIIIRASSIEDTGATYANTHTMPIRYIPAALILISLLFAIAHFYRVESDAVAKMHVTVGTVVALGNQSSASSTRLNGESSSANTQAIVEFKVGDDSFRVRGRALGIPRWVPGQAVEVYFSPANPKHARINRWDEVYLISSVLILFLSGGLVFACVNFAVYKVRGKPLS